MDKLAVVSSVGENMDISYKHRHSASKKSCKQNPHVMLEYSAQVISFPDQNHLVSCMVLVI
jgi:hypothetical protein